MQLADLERARAEKAKMSPDELAEMKRKNVRLTARFYCVLRTSNMLTRDRSLPCNSPSWRRRR